MADLDRLRFGQDLDAVATRVLDLVAEMSTQHLDEHTSNNLTTSVGRTRRFFINKDAGWRPLELERSVFVTLETKRPAGIRVVRHFSVAANLDPADEFVLKLGHSDGDELLFRMSDVHPQLTTSFRLRLEAWVGGALRQAAEELVADASG